MAQVTRIDGETVRLFFTALNLNSAGSDNALAIPDGVSTKYVVRRVSVYDASTSLTTATLGLFTAAAGGGLNLVSSGILTTLTGATIVFDMTLAAATRRTEATLFLRNVLAQGGAATATVCVELQPLV